MNFPFSAAFYLPVWPRCVFIWFISLVAPLTISPATNTNNTFFFVFSTHFPTFLLCSLAFFPSFSTDRSRLTWRTQPNTTSSAPSSSRWSGTWESLALRCWAYPAPTSPLTTGACRQGRATAPPTALWPYWPWTLTARKRWGLAQTCHSFSQ